MRTLSPFFLAFICLLFSNTVVSAQSSTRAIMNNMLSAINNTNSLSFHMKSWERIDGKMKTNEAEVKLIVKPRQMYLKSVGGENSGVEVLWIEGKYNGNALVKPNGFPYMSIKLDPYGSLMRKDQHHTIMNTGFLFFAGIINAAFNYAGDKMENHFINKGDVLFNGKKCYKIEIVDPTFRYNTYTVNGTETVDDIANKHNICGYLIIEKNSNVSGFTSLRSGTQIQIPSTYAKKTVLYIDKENYLPIGQFMYDEKGQLFERYEFHNLVLNPRFSSEEFSENYKDYNF